ncbi:MAG: sn-glycerol-3-phosphate ABC transporter ATP-binding protein UgpC [Rhodobacteraceae bacterium]|jgi:ABC-type sugar transport system ATPase subunit|nr:sn-glycerol-3-phosphate ABC transporter ATP-binding protein UgpC [Paracoccaceae bacterium]
MASLELKGLKKRYGDLQVIHGLDLSVEKGEFIVFVGPSGCGKSTALRMICGLETLSEGDILIGGNSVRNVPPARRGVAMVFQSYALYPHMTVAENMGFSLRMEGVPKAERAGKVAEAARILQLEELLARKPKELSGGQRQRVAIGRAIVRKPEVFLFDEPLSNLDAELRVQMRFELARLHRAIGATMIYVTHDQVEAMTLADRIVVLRSGRVEQIGTPMDLYHRPRNMFVAGFIGSPKMNFFAARVVSVSDAGVEITFDGLRGGPLVLQRRSAALAAGDQVTLGVRPEHLVVNGNGAAGVEAEVEFWEELGSSSYAYAPGFGAGAVVASAHRVPDATVTTGLMPMTFAAERCMLFDAGGLTVF